MECVERGNGKGKERKEKEQDSFEIFLCSSVAMSPMNISGPHHMCPAPLRSSVCHVTNKHKRAVLRGCLCLSVSDMENRQT
jgi:hypothetical protein